MINAMNIVPVRTLISVLCLAISHAFSSKVFAQKNLKDTTIYVVKAFQPTIADANKINLAPVVKDSTPPVLYLTYSIRSTKINTPFKIDSIKPAKMVGEPLTKLYHTLIKAGVGNYNTPYAEIFYNSLRSKTSSVGVYLKHLSSSGKVDNSYKSAFSDNQIGLYSKKFLRKQTLAGNLNFNRNAENYNVLHDDSSDIVLSSKFRRTTIGGDVSLQSHFNDSVHLDHNTGIKFYRLIEKESKGEINITAGTDLSKIYEKQFIHAPVNFQFYRSNSINDFLVTLAPYIVSSGKKWKADLGFYLAVEKGKTPLNFFIFPSVDFSYNAFNDVFIPYAGICNEKKRNSILAMSKENPFVMPGTDASSTATNAFYAGIKGSASKTINYNTSVSFVLVDNLNMYVQDYTIPRTAQGFNTIQDNATLLALNVEIQYQQSDKIKIIARGQYNKYTMKNQQYAWQKPLWQSSLGVNYNLQSKIVAMADIFIYGQRFGRATYQDQNAIIEITSELKPIVDANIGLEYRYTKKLGAFLKLNNIGFKNYNYWDNYSVYSFNFMLGISATF